MTLAKNHKSRRFSRSITTFVFPFKRALSKKREEILLEVDKEIPHYVIGKAFE